MREYLKYLWFVINQQESVNPFTVHSFYANVVFLIACKNLPISKQSGSLLSGYNHFFSCGYFQMVSQTVSLNGTRGEIPTQLLGLKPEVTQYNHH